MNSSCCSEEKEDVFAIILAAGKGVRFEGSEYPKQFTRILGKPLFIHCLETYFSMKEVKNIYLVINEEFKKLFNRVLSEYQYTERVIIIPGGIDRQHSVTQALDRISINGVVVVQNGVSPVTSSTLIRKCIQVAKEKGAVTAFVNPFHTVFEKEGEELDKVLERKSLGYTCDPQVYRISIIKEAIAYAKHHGLKDRPTVDLVRRLGLPVYLVESDPSNIKVTINADISAIEHILKNTQS
jgi:2-C-methyl-D-erythritol 4-phosphate cytidylyltransferase